METNLLNSSKTRTISTLHLKMTCLDLHSSWKMCTAANKLTRLFYVAAVFDAIKSRSSRFWWPTNSTWNYTHSTFSCHHKTKYRQNLLLSHPFSLFRTPSKDYGCVTTVKSKPY